MTSMLQLDTSSLHRPVEIGIAGVPCKVEVQRSEEEGVLWRQWLDQHDIAAAHQLARRYRPLVLEVVRDHCRAELPTDDLVAEAQIGLMRAICRFSPATYSSFGRYAALFMHAALHAQRYRRHLRSIERV
jgi:DNA-directed RNA polymerase specialized sigma subunit